MTVAEAVTALTEAGWLSVADDLREGVPPGTVLSRLNQLAWEAGEDGHTDEGYDEAIEIVARISTL